MTNIEQTLLDFLKEIHKISTNPDSISQKSKEKALRKCASISYSALEYHKEMMYD